MAPCCAGERLGSGEQQVVAGDDPEIPHAESDEARDGKDDGREKVLSRGKREARGADRGGEGQHVGKRPIMLAKRTGSDDEGDPNQEYTQKEEQARVREKAEFFRRRGKARSMAGKRAPGQVHREAKGGKKGAKVHAAQADHDPFLPFPDAVQERLPWRALLNDRIIIGDCMKKQRETARISTKPGDARSPAWASSSGCVDSADEEGFLPCSPACAASTK